jgi:hypothetical protein
MFVSKTSDSNGLPDRWRKASIRCRLIDTPTKIRPVNAAAALTRATKKFPQAVMP